MTSFTFDKDIDDIERPELMDEGWYKFQVAEEPKVEKNKAAKDNKSYDDGAGMNLVIKLRVIDAIDETYNGRKFTLYLPFPVPEDLDEYDGRGMKKYDAKMERIADFAEKASGCSAVGNEISIMPQAQVGAYIIKDQDNQGEPTNSLNWFQGFIRPEDVDLPEEIAEGGDDMGFEG